MNALAWGHLEWVGGEDWAGAAVPGCWWAASTALTGCPGGLEHLIPVQPRWPSRQRLCPAGSAAPWQLSRAAAPSVAVWGVLQGPGGPTKHHSPRDTQCPHGCALCPTAGPGHGIMALSLSAGRGNTGIQGCQALEFPLHPVAGDLGMELGWQQL